jgi:hypothetical protein
MVSGQSGHDSLVSLFSTLKVNIYKKNTLARLDITLIIKTLLLFADPQCHGT